MTIDALHKAIRRMHYPPEVMLTCVRRYVAYPLSLRHIEEMMHERGVFVDHTTVHRWAIKIVPVLAAVFRRRMRPVGRSSRMDETYVKIAGQWQYLYRAVAGTAIRSIFFSDPSAIAPRHAGSWRVPLPAMASPNGSPST